MQDQVKSRGVPSPFAKTMAINVSASMTRDNGFHTKPKNLQF
jgi:hypothetical protein